MDITTVTQLISTVGFPIAMCALMAWFTYDQTEKHRKEVTDLNNQHAEEMTKVTDALNNNTIALTKLCEKLDKE